MVLDTDADQCMVLLWYDAGGDGDDGDIIKYNSVMYCYISWVFTWKILSYLALVQLYKVVIDSIPIF